MSVGLAVFDLDGTLIDSSEDLATAGNAARKHLGLSALSTATVASYVGDGLDRLIERLIEDPLQRPEAKRVFQIAYDQDCCATTRPYPGVVEALTQLQAADWCLAVATNKPLIFAMRMLDELGLGEFFGDLVRGGDQAKKPDPGQLIELMQVTGIPAAQTWMIGDHHTDLQAGRAAGVSVMWCSWGIGRRDAGPIDAIAESPHAWGRLLGAVVP
jgi:phosphoglycolate phosphatase